MEMALCSSQIKQVILQWMMFKHLSAQDDRAAWLIQMLKGEPNSTSERDSRPGFDGVKIKLLLLLLLSVSWYSGTEWKGLWGVCLNCPDCAHMVWRSDSFINVLPLLCLMFMELFKNIQWNIRPFEGTQKKNSNSITFKTQRPVAAWPWQSPATPMPLWPKLLAGWKSTSKQLPKSV